MLIAVIVVFLAFVVFVIRVGTRNPRRMPKTGKIIGYKKVYVIDKYDTVCDSVIATLEIPKDALRNQEILRRKYLEPKCRASKAKVLSLKSCWGGAPVSKAYSYYDRDFSYEVGKIVTPKRSFDTSNETCASGIHFYMLEKDARNH